MKNRYKLSIIAPVYQNENIKDIVKDINKKISMPFKKKYGDIEFIIAEDGSTDNTRRILKAIKTKYNLTLDLFDKKRGYVAAVKKLYLRAKGEYIFFTDSDGEHDPADFWKLWKKMIKENSDIVVGYKIRRKPFYRVFISKINNLLLGILFGVWLKDANCGFRLLKRNAVERIIPGTGNLTAAYNAETLILAKRFGYRYSEVPIKHIYKESTVFSVKKLPKTISKAFFETISLRYKLWVKG